MHTSTIGCRIVCKNSCNTIISIIFDSILRILDHKCIGHVCEGTKRIHKFNFDQETMASGAKTHVALVDKAANMTEALVMKSRYTTQTTEIEEYGDNGEYSRDEHRVMVNDYGGDEVLITEKRISITESYVPRINIV